MRNKKINLFATIVCIIYITAVLFYIFSLAAEYITGPSTVEKRLSDLTRETSRNLNVNEIGSEAFSQGLLRSMGNVSDIAALQVVCGGKLYFSYPSDPTKTAAATSSLVITRNISLNTNDGQPVQFTVALYRLKPSSIFYKGRIAFFAVLAATLLSIIYLAYMYIFASPAKEPEEESFDDDYDEALDDIDAFNENDSIDFEEGIAVMASQQEKPSIEKVALPEPVKVPESVHTEVVTENSDKTLVSDFDSKETSIESIDNDENLDNIDDVIESDDEIDFDIEESDDNFFSDVLSEEDKKETQNEDFDDEDNSIFDESLDQESDSFEEPFSEEDSNDDLNFEIDNQNPITADDTVSDKVGSVTEEKKEVVVADEIKTEEKESVELNEPKGLFNPTTGFGWEDYMLPRLDSELVRAASSEQDLALFTLRIVDIDWTTFAGKEVINIILETAKFKDQIFDFKNDGCSIIMQGLNIDQAIEIAENLHVELISCLSKYEQYNTVAIGISTRSLRLISGNRIVNESEQALSHALEDKDSPIVAFKVNPEKYRNYLAAEAEKSDSNK